MSLTHDDPNENAATVTEAAAETAPEPGLPPEPPPIARSEGTKAGGRLRRFFWMDERMEAAIREGFGPGQAGWKDYDLGRSALESAEQLSESEELKGARLLLTRAAAVLLGRATLARSGVNVAPMQTSEKKAEQRDIELGREALRASEHLNEADGAEVASHLLRLMAADLFTRAQLESFPCLSDVEWDNLAQLPGVAERLGKLPDAERARVAVALGTDGGSRLAALSNDERQATERSLLAVARELAPPLSRDAGRKSRVYLARWFRIGLSVSLVLGLALFFGLREERIEGPNLALHRHVTMSSLYRAGNVGHDPSRLVDGDLTGFGFHTDQGGPQHVIIDLGEVHSIRRVVVYNRTDCCMEKAVPLSIEVSDDGKKYTEVATRERTFDVWKATFSAVGARYVKLTSTSGEYFHLAEVEVY